MASPPLPTKYVALIEIAHEETVFNRALLTPIHVIASDLEFYYTRLLGLHGATVSVEYISVPAEFNESLLTPLYTAPTEYPSHDLATERANVAHREKYKTYIRQLCEMENSRVSLHFFQRRAPPSSVSAQVSTEETYVNDYITNRRRWVDEILEALNAENDCATDAIALRKVRKEYTPTAWIITPSIAAIRAQRGSRIVFDAAIGKHWENLLGSSLYPDLLVSRRLTTITWTFQDPTADAMLDTILKWYVASQGAAVKDGISDFILDADKEIASLINAVKKIKVAEKHMTIDPEIHNDACNAVYLLLAQVEAKMLSSATTDNAVAPLTYDTFMRFMTYVYQAENIPKDEYKENAGIQQILTRWVRCNLGFRCDATPINGTWNTIWNLTMRGAPSIERMNHFLATMDSWDPLLLNVYGRQERHAIAQEWMRIYVDTQLEHDPLTRIKSVILYEQIKTFCGQYLPMDIYAPTFSLSYIGQVLTRKGLSSAKLRHGRYTQNVRFKYYVPETEDAMETIVPAAPPPAPPTPPPAPPMRTQAKITNTVASSETIRIEQFFVSASAETIHLGTL
jgi:hypothetical protein